MSDLFDKWDKNNVDELDKPFYKQLCVWPGTTLGDWTPEQFEQFMKEEFGVRTKFVEEVVTNAGDGGEGGRHDLFFYVHSNDVGKFAVPRLQAGIRWWEDVVGNNSHMIYSKEIIDKYPTQW